MNYEYLLHLNFKHWSKEGAYSVQFSVVHHQIFSRIYCTRFIHTRKDSDETNPDLTWISIAKNAVLVLSKNILYSLLSDKLSAKVVQTLHAILSSAAKFNLSKVSSFRPFDTVKLKELPSIIPFQIQRTYIALSH